MSDDVEDGFGDIMRVLKKAAENVQQKEDARPPTPAMSATAERPKWPTEFAKEVVRENGRTCGAYVSSIVELAKAFLDQEARGVRRETELLDRIRRLEADLTTTKASTIAPEQSDQASLDARLAALERWMWGAVE